MAKYSILGGVAFSLVAVAGIQSATAQDDRRYRDYGEPRYQAYDNNYDTPYEVETRRFDVTGGLAGGNSGVRSLRTQDRVRTFFNDLDRVGSGK